MSASVTAPILCTVSDELPRLVRIPRHLLHATFDDLPALGVPEPARLALQGLLADLPLVPDASYSAVLLGRPAVTIPCLVVLARHVAQGLRDHNVALMNHHDPSHLKSDRLKLIFLAGEQLASLFAQGDPRLRREAVLCTWDVPATVLDLLIGRQQARLASFAAATVPSTRLASWRRVDLTP